MKVVQKLNYNQPRTIQYFLSSNSCSFISLFYRFHSQSYRDQLFVSKRRYLSILYFNQSSIIGYGTVCDAFYYLTVDYEWESNYVFLHIYSKYLDSCQDSYLVKRISHSSSLKSIRQIIMTYYITPLLFNLNIKYFLLIINNLSNLLTYFQMPLLLIFFSVYIYNFQYSLFCLRDNIMGSCMMKQQTKKIFTENQQKFMREIQSEQLSKEIQRVQPFKEIKKRQQSSKKITREQSNQVLKQEFLKLNWPVTCKNLLSAYLKFTIAESYQNMNQEDIECVMCEFYILQKNSLHNKKLIGRIQIFYYKEDHFQFQVPKKIHFGQSFQYILYFILRDKHIYRVYNSIDKKRYEYIPQIQLVTKKDNHQNIAIILSKVDQIKQSDYKINILLVGRVGIGKSTFISNTIEKFQECFPNMQKILKPFTSNMNSTVTKTFTRYQFEKQGIRLIDGPGFMFSNRFNSYLVDQYLENFKALLAGRFNYDEFQLPGRTNIKQVPQLFKSNYEYDQVIHLVLIMTDLNSIIQQAEINKKLIQCCLHYSIDYLLLINKIDLCEQEYTGAFYAQILQSLQIEGYTNYEKILPLCLKQYELENSLACEYLYLSVLKKALTQALIKISEYTIHLYYYYDNGQKKYHIKIWKQQEVQSKLGSISKKYFNNRQLSKIEIKQNNEWKGMNRRISQKPLKNFVRYLPQMKQYMVQFRDKSDDSPLTII